MGRGGWEGRFGQGEQFKGAKRGRSVFDLSIPPGFIYFSSAFQILVSTYLIGLRSFLSAMPLKKRENSFLHLVSFYFDFFFLLFHVPSDMVKFVTNVSSKVGSLVETKSNGICFLLGPYGAEC